jgi:hypothetical protein
MQEVHLSELFAQDVSLDGSEAIGFLCHCYLLFVTDSLSLQPI